MTSQYKYLGIVVTLLALCAVMFMLGANDVQKDFDAYKQKQTILAQEQALKAKQTELENAKRTDAITQFYENNIARLNAALRVRPAANSNTVSAVAPGSQSADGTRPAAPGACEGTEFYDRAMKTELMLESWQAWAQSQNFPVQ